MAIKKQLVCLIQCLFISTAISTATSHATSSTNATTTVNWNGIAITNNVTDENIIISGNNTLANSVTVTANTKNIEVTLASANTTIDGNNNALNFCINNGCAITIKFENNIFTLSNIIVNAQPHLDLIFNNGTDGKLLLNNARWLWK